MVDTTTGSMGLSCRVGVFSMELSTSIPSITLPNTGCLEGVERSK